MESILTLEEAAHLLKVAPITLYRKARRGEVPAAKLGKSWRFHRGQLEEWLKESASLRRPRSPGPEAFRHLSSRETHAILRFIEILKDRCSHALEGVILYGSRARGDFRGDSDIDLLILLKNDKEPLKKEIGKAADRFNLENDVRLQTLCISSAEWARPSFRTFLLLEKIRREGIPLHG